MVFVGHLDLMRLLDRALRRAALPVASDASPFHARPQIFTAVALPLGATSSCEFLEAFLTRGVKPEQALQVGGARAHGAEPVAAAVIACLCWHC
jgi:uncharacterized protein (DUF2344 family)